MTENPNEKHGRGRPTNEEKKKIDDIIQDYYLKGIGQPLVIRETGLNKNTVYSKYKELDQKFADSNDTDFLIKLRQEKMQLSLSLDDLALRTYKVLDKIEEKILNYNQDDTEELQPLLQRFLDITRNLVLIKREKKEINAKPALDQKLKDTIRTMVEEHE